MKKYIFYGVFLILWGVVLSVFEENEIVKALNLLMTILIFILYELIDMNDNKKGSN